MRAIDADALIADCQLAQKQADRHGREFTNAFYSGGGEVSTEWWCVEDMIENAPTIEPQRTGRWIFDKNDYLTKCSECGCHPWFGVIPTVKEATKKLPHCPMCLAKMEGE